MSNNTNLSGIELSAALAEEIYRRADGDNPIDVVSDIGTTLIDLQPFLDNTSGLHLNSSATPENKDYYFYSSKGFVGRSRAGSKCSRKPFRPNWLSGFRQA